MRYFISLFILLNLGQSVHAQDLLKERIWKLADKKRSIYFDKGIFHFDSKASTQVLNSMRNSYIPGRGYERIVFDFSSNSAPRVYGHIATKENKLYMDFFNVTMSKPMDAINNARFIEKIDFFNIDKGNVSLEMLVTKGVSFDIFYLENPGRVIVDIKK